MFVRSKAPYRVSFGGGGTDMEPYCVDHGGCVINTAIDRHIYISLEPRKDNKIHINSIDYGKDTTFSIGDNDYSTDFELFKGIVESDDDIPFEIKEIRYADDPLTSVAEGLLIKAIAEGED